MRPVRLPVSLAAAALVLALVPAQNPVKQVDAPQPAAAPGERRFIGDLDLDIAHSVTEGDLTYRSPQVLRYYWSFNVLRIRTAITMTFPQGSDRPSSVTISPSDLQFYIIAVEQWDPGDIPDACRGYALTASGRGRLQAYSGGVSAAEGGWSIQGLSLTVSPTTPDVTGLGGDCKPGIDAVKKSFMDTLRSLANMPGSTPWVFKEGYRFPYGTKTGIEGSCDNPLFAQSLGRVQCRWEVHETGAAPPLVPKGHPRVIPPRRR